ncbi:binding-protein-dependent transport systems inner membrane component [Dinoroseobacter shibae DFL 12 = DSM 16493]|jgi:glycine betaine/proline transport system permease protein|uniref:Binding-protein-dependent transport systems inner membrane component n=1 Tax=Dinoroseobacter shibae (strain DSM 16493 / NCIMB 14021 / DFL 12) TaxID=398580 RepID=A8LJF6_DINSH|nr:ABC transporter permease subunit [Dinoroseobacter shibae]ABV93178.1 binding-protein-dependent transport systems inner membrane component [Dinoroseobacter shibae DFL 12 = DSM 16493]URF48104.1 ABC transporter permease subunit [Dinoroseobacter shibae]URF52414.1 ABC transporter permease subunit [Dinoroseobacter shibae]
MKDSDINPLEDTESAAALAYAADRRANIATFVRTNPDYYAAMFDKIGASSKFVPTINLMAGLFGPVWFGARGLWNWALAFLILETLALVQIARGLFGDLAADAMARIASIEGTLELRRQQLAAAIESGSDRVDAFRRTVESLEANIGGIRAEAEAMAAEGPTIALTGLVLLILAKIAQAVIANTALEARFSEWLSDRSIRSGMPPQHIVLSAIFMGLIVATAMVHYSFPGRFDLLSTFPTDPDIRLTGIAWVEDFIAWTVRNTEAFFDALTFGIRTLLDALEVILVQTPWIVIASLIVLLTWLTAGLRTAIYSSAFLAYMGLLGFWEAAMTTLALLGTAACLSIVIGIPLGMFAARRPRFYAFIQPIMDFMQTMPAFVFMVPVIAFFGVGKPAAVIVTMIFGGTPVVRLTVLGLRGVPESVREAAISFGANKWYLLTKVDLPLAGPSIRAGINQTIMLSLAMVVVASLIGAKGLGEDVLEALQYANVGQGILAGFSILFCAMILDRIVQGARK